MDRDFTSEDMAPVMHELMLRLGFGDGYVSQGGDLGSFVARQLAVQYDECKGKLKFSRRNWKAYTNFSQLSTVSIWTT